MARHNDIDRYYILWGKREKSKKDNTHSFYVVDNEKI